MLKDRKNIGIIILIIIVIIALIILVTKIAVSDKEKEKMDVNVLNKEENTISTKNQQNSILLSNEEKQEGMNELSHIMENKTNKCVLIINGEKVSEKELAYVDFQKNSEVLHKGEEKKDTINEIIKEYVVAQDAKNKDIFLSDKENKEIEERVKKNFQKDNKGTSEVLNATHMEYEEFVEFYTNRMKRLELQTKWSLYITDAIKSGELSTENNDFNAKCKECKKYSESKETVSKAINLLFELIEEYKELLKKKAKIEYMN